MRSKPVELGDAVSEALGIVGITEERVTKWLGRPCGCNERRENLNQLSRWAKRVLLGRTDKARDYIEKIIDDASTDKDNYTVIEQCRICYSTNLEDIISLGDLYVSDFIPKDAQCDMKAPITLTRCDHCGLVQLRHTASPSFIFSRNYWYSSSTTQSMINALKDVAEECSNRVTLKKEDVVLDIGSNDGTLLRSYDQKGIIKVGVEPAKNFENIGSNGIEIFINDFWSAAAYHKQVKKRAKIITAIEMLYGVDDPNRFIADVASSLHQDGLFVVQLMTLKTILDANSLGHLTHERLQFYTIRSLTHLYKNNGLRIVDIEYNDVNGGSYRIYATPRGGSIQQTKDQKQRIQRLKGEEESLNSIDMYARWFSHINENKEKTRSFIKGEKEKGKSVWVYGASTKANIILQFYELDTDVIDAVVEIDRRKIGRVMAGTKIPILSTKAAHRKNPDYYLLFSPFFLDEFKEKEKEWVDGGGKFIVPLPEFKVI